MSARPVLVWLRQDLRTTDHPALTAAIGSGAPVVPVYILDDRLGGQWRLGGASRWWLAGSLKELAREFGRLGSPLVLRRGPAAPTLISLARETNARAVFWTAAIEPHWQAEEGTVTRALTAADCQVATFSGSLLFPPGHIVSRSGRPLKVFTPFWRACLAAAPPPTPLPAPSILRPPATPVASQLLADLELEPTRPNWAAGLRETWTPGQTGAEGRLNAFLDSSLETYPTLRDRPEPSVTSMLSPHLHWGEISPRQVWHAVAMRADALPKLQGAAEAFLREVGWREFYANILIAHPSSPEAPLDSRFDRFPWLSDNNALTMWQRGHTGYPIIDAGMRQLWRIGWMHNRVRMIVASFLIKDLLIPWQAGARWFWDTLVDADLASNTGGWQWVAGCGTDAAPYFRIFNPVSQGERFDPSGAYVRRWVPELQGLRDAVIHRPWEASPLEREAAGVRLGQNYPHPIVDHGHARRRALTAYARVKGTA